MMPVYLFVKSSCVEEKLEKELRKNVKRMELSKIRFTLH